MHMCNKKILLYINFIFKPLAVFLFDYFLFLMEELIRDHTS